METKTDGRTDTAQPLLSRCGASEARRHDRISGSASVSYSGALELQRLGGIPGGTPGDTPTACLSHSKSVFGQHRGDTVSRPGPSTPTEHQTTEPPESPTDACFLRSLGACANNAA
ncbi:hypothetical protein NDU88_005307 [Pleurodeles waltl]|uniref:Uncharacterized protein n=1 Tax=Pleurodeles waltl TaxID=8319 RepID=A0AAV7RIP3_PLEWA|nr:hypothetical protein NDU88_005307 [Pleurodeles waltl]